MVSVGLKSKPRSTLGLHPVPGRARDSLPLVIFRTTQRLPGPGRARGSLLRVFFQTTQRSHRHPIPPGHLRHTRSFYQLLAIAVRFVYLDSPLKGRSPRLQGISARISLLATCNLVTRAAAGGVRGSTENCILRKRACFQGPTARPRGSELRAPGLRLLLPR